MTQRSVLALGFLAVMGMLVGGCAMDEMMGSGGTGSATTSTSNIDRVASGAAEDSLNGCLARIPTDASAGQKMLAEESCRRDQASRR